MHAIRLIPLFIIFSLMTTTIGVTSFKESRKEEIDNDGVVISTANINHKISSMKGWFTENQGQISNTDVKYIYVASGLSIGFIEGGYLIKFTDEENFSKIVKVTFNSGKQVLPEGREELHHRSNFFKGNDSLKWRIGVPNYEKVVYNNLYEGIDLVFYANEKGLKYDFIVHPHANPETIRWSYEGINTISVDDAGNLHIKSNFNDYMEANPYSYQMTNGKKTKVDCHYMVTNETAKFSIGNYDRSKQLIIDPLIYSTYIGGSSRDRGYGIAIDSADNSYITGYTHSIDFPTTTGCYDDVYDDGVQGALRKLLMGMYSYVK